MTPTPTRAPRRPIVQISLDLTSIAEALDHARLAAGRLDPWPLVGRVEPLAGWQSCFDGMASGEIVKGVLKPAG
ncbi:MAG TPA: hypothetical protein VJV74_04470 [Terriglobia bacterium]|nr:hypothetical protein [Terriglobia bacterium]